MLRYTVRKFVGAIILILVVLVINFMILRLTPGNPYDTQLISLLQTRQGNNLTTSQQLQLEQLKARSITSPKVKTGNCRI